MTNKAGHIDFQTASCLPDFPPISLEEMREVRLMDRVDTKYVTNETVLLQILAEANRQGYRALESVCGKIQPYDSIYFDTGCMDMYRDHHNRRLVRQKIRTRQYLHSGDTYLEIKKKNNKSRTKKKRMAIPAAAFRDYREEPVMNRFVEEYSGYRPEQLHPCLETVFNRITLVNAAKTERVTIDSSLRFVNVANSVESDLGNAVVIELKQEGRAASGMKRILLDLRVKPLRMSKYCIGTALTDPQVPNHRFKLKIRKINKIAALCTNI